MNIFYHNDADGRLSAWLIRKHNECFGEEIKFFEMTYDKPFPPDVLSKGKACFILDYSVKPEVMKEIIANSSEVVWIDHHKSAIEAYKDWDGPVIDGVRDTSMSGCELTNKWLGLSPNRVVDLVGDFDTWQFKFGEHSNRFRMGLECFNQDPSRNDCVWERIIGIDIMKDEDIVTLDQVFEAGRAVINYLEAQNKQQFKTAAYQTTFHDHPATVINSLQLGRKQFDNTGNANELMIVWFFNGKQYKVSIYSEIVDVAKIAEQYGGGGHKGAAGFVIDHLPFHPYAYCAAQLAKPGA